MRLLQLADVLERAGLTVNRVNGWEQRGSDYFAPLGVMIHHTGARSRTAAPSLGVVLYGRPDLPGPLSQVLIGRDLTCHVIASGRANHAGVGHWPPLPQATGNTSWVGIEVENDGVNEPWSRDLYDTTATAATAICRDMGWGADRVIGHKEWAPRRKIDPLFNMAGFRIRVADLIPDDDEEFDVDTRTMIDQLHQALVRAPVERNQLDVRNLDLGTPILSTNHAANLLLADAAKGDDPEAVASALVDKLGPEFAGQLVAAVGRILVESGRA